MKFAKFVEQHLRMTASDNISLVSSRVSRFLLNPLLANVPILYPLKTPENLGFLVFSGGEKWEHWPEMG